MSRARAVAQRLLTAAVRGRRAQGRPWGEAVLAEHDHVHGTWPAIRWAAGGLRIAWREKPAGTRRLVLAVIVLAVVGQLGTVTLGPAYEPSGGMAPTVPVAGFYLLDKVGFHLTGLRHGDVVAFPIPGKASGSSSGSSACPATGSPAWVARWSATA